MPSRQRRNTPTVQDLANTLDRLEIRLTERDQVMTEGDRATTERLNQADNTIDKHPEFDIVGRGELGYDNKPEMTDKALYIALEKYNMLEIICEATASN